MNENTGATSGAAAAGDVAVRPVEKPIQADREAAAGFAYYYGIDRARKNAMLDGGLDKSYEVQAFARHRLAAEQAARTTTTEGGMWECVVPACPVSEECADILAMLSENGGSGEIGAAAVAGVDTIWGYADPAETEQTAQIERARGNIVVAIRAAVAGITLVPGEPSHGF